MKYLLVLLLIVGVTMYLNRAYAYFYDFQGDHFIGNPSYTSPHYFNKDWNPEVKKLMILGDSLMAGTGSSREENSMAYMISQNLAKDENIELINLAEPGVGVEDVLNRQVPNAIAEKPDYIILMIGTNDVHNRLSEKVFKDDYEQIINKLTQNTTAKITIINIPFIGSSKILYPPWSVMLDLRIRQFNKIISKLSSNRDLEVIDLYNQFKDQFKQPSDLYSEDQFHPSDKGYALWAQFINANISH